MKLTIEENQLIIESLVMNYAVTQKEAPMDLLGKLTKLTKITSEEEAEKVAQRLEITATYNAPEKS